MNSKTLKCDDIWGEFKKVRIQFLKSTLVEIECSQMAAEIVFSISARLAAFKSAKSLITIWTSISQLLKTDVEKYI